MTVDGVELPDVAQDLPSSGFEWGYLGTEPMRLSHAILADCLGETADVEQTRGRFLETVVRYLGNWWQLDEAQVREAIAE